MNSDFSPLKMLLWVSRAVFHSGIVFGFAYGSVLSGIISPDGYSDGLWTHGAIVNLMLVLVVNAKVRARDAAPT